MKILFTMTPAFNPNAGGVQRTTYKLGKYFTESGLDVFYYSLDNVGHLDVEFGRLYSAPQTGKNKNPTNIKDLKKVLNEVKPDVVINQMPYEKELRQVLATCKKDLNYALFGCLRNSLFNFKSNVRDRMHQMLPSTIFKLMDNSIGIGIIQLRHWLKHRKDLKAIIDEHDFFILLAPPNKKELKYFVGDYKPNKVLSIPNSIPEIHPEALKKKEKIILHVGRINIQQKRSDLLIPFWEELCQKIPDWKFVIVGDGEYMSKIKSELAEKNLPRIELMGYQKPEAFFEKSAIFMMPSAYEGFPNTIIEAQSYGCVPLAYNSYKALEWIVKDGENALLSPAFDSSHMASCAEFLISDNLNSWQLNSIENAQRFTIDVVGQVWLDFFHDVLE